MKKAKTSKKTVKASKCTDPVCKLMTGPKGKAFGKAGQAFYKDYLKLAKKQKNKEAIEGLSHAIVEMTAMSKGQLCACTDGGDCGCC